MISAAHLQNVINTVINILIERPYDLDGGSVARWYKVNESVGVKMYRNKELRDTTYALQRIFGHFGIAPKLGQKFEFKYERFDGIRTMYGYVSEAVTPMRELNSEAEERDFDEAIIEWYKERDSERQKLKDIMCKHGLRHGDLHEDNWGITNDGRYVVLDFTHAFMKSKIGQNWVYTENCKIVNPLWHDDMLQELQKKGFVYEAG